MHFLLPEKRAYDRRRVACFPKKAPTIVGVFFRAQKVVLPQFW